MPGILEKSWADLSPESKLRAWWAVLASPALCCFHFRLDAASLLGLQQMSLWEDKLFSELCCCFGELGLSYHFSVSFLQKHHLMSDLVVLFKVHE